MILTVTMNPAVDIIYEVEDFRANKVFRPVNMMTCAGGKGINVARVIRELIGEVSATGFIGGSNGLYIERELKREGINNKFYYIQDNTRTSIHIIDQKNDTTTAVLESGPCIEEREIKGFLKKFEEMIQDCKVIIASGSLPAGLPDNFYQVLIDISRKKNVYFLLDTSSSYLKNGINSGPYMVKPNEDEVKQLFDVKEGKITDYIPVLNEFREKGIDLPVITLGKYGCITLIENEVYQFIPPEVKAKNPVGSGDAFMGGCGAGIYKDLDPMETIKLALACGTANSLFLKNGIITKERVNEIKRKIKIRKCGE
ncbi:MAG: 1-phosphofructokinase family hexose kinase [Halanaerobiaceae bacterium]|nr:1-phosphofructokinase family hexose kinase [Halanaerobiaceae bacterium]